MKHQKAWPLLLALGMGAFAIGTAEFSSMSLLPFYAAALGRDQPSAAYAVSAYALGVVVGAPLLAVLTAHMARAAAAAWLIAAVGTFNLLTALVGGFGAMVATRFLSGLPHGAFFGQAALLAATAMPTRRAQSVALVMTGLTLATVVGSPLANLLGQTVGWRWGFVLPAAAAAVSATGLVLLAPHLPARPGTSPLRELGALRLPQVWLTLGVGAIGFGGMFAVYAFLPAIVTQTAGAPARIVPWVLVVFGVGMTIGNVAAGWAADRALAATGIVMLAWSAVTLAVLPLVAGDLHQLVALLFAIALGGGIGPVLQTRLMDVAGDAQTLAAALHHSAFNVANALGPFLAGLVIASGYGWSAAGPVGSAMALVGLAILLVAILFARGRVAMADGRTDPS